MVTISGITLAYPNRETVGRGPGGRVPGLGKFLVLSDLWGSLCIFDEVHSLILSHNAVLKLAWLNLGLGFSIYPFIKDV